MPPPKCLKEISMQNNSPRKKQIPSGKLLRDPPPRLSGGLIELITSSHTKLVTVKVIWSLEKLCRLSVASKLKRCIGPEEKFSRSKDSNVSFGSDVKSGTHVSRTSGRLSSRQQARISSRCDLMTLWTKLE